VRKLLFVAVAGLAVAAAGCGLDSSGLSPEDGGGSLDDSAVPPLDGTTGNADASGADDATIPPAETGGGENDSSRDDVVTAQDSPSDAEGEDAGEDAGVDSGVDGGTDAGPDTGADAGADASADTGADSGADARAEAGTDAGTDSGGDSGDDAADGACTGACTAGVVPAGWTVVEYAETSQPACSTGYGSPVDALEGPNGAPATCGCSCDVTTPGTCESGNITVAANGLIGCSTMSVTAPANGGACSPAVMNWSPPNDPKLQVTPVGYTAGACTPRSSITTAPVTYVGQGRICSSTSSPSGTCPGGGSCATPPEGFTLCLAQAGTAACPAGFTHPHTVGSGIADARSCTACTCGDAGATCANQTLTLFTNTSCSTGAQSVKADGNCDDFPGPSGAGAPTYDAYEYTATVDGEGCPASSVSAEGTVTLTGVQTVCCP
jgi:hypothetical protein